MKIKLDKYQDENSVFESINSAGMPLSGPDLIKNFLFTFRRFTISREQEQQLVLLYTEKFETLFRSFDKSADETEAFFREYIAVKTGEKVRKDPKTVYYAFKKWVGTIDSYERCRATILDLVKWGIIFVTLRQGTHPDIDRNNLGYIRASFFTYAALLMDMADKLGRVEEGQLLIYDRMLFNKSLRSVVVYDVSRFLAGRAVKAIARFIPTVPKVLEEHDTNYFHDYAGAFERLVTTQGKRISHC